MGIILIALSVIVSNMAIKEFDNEVAKLAFAVFRITETTAGLIPAPTIFFSDFIWSYQTNNPNDLCNQTAAAVFASCLKKNSTSPIF